MQISLLPSIINCVIRSSTRTKDAAGRALNGRHSSLVTRHFSSLSPCHLVTLSCLFLGWVATPSWSFELAQPGNVLCYYTSPVDGTAQPYFLYVPTTYDPDRPTPLVLELHGFGGRAYPAAGDWWRQNWANGEGWILASLDGRGSQNWDGIGEDDIFNVIRDLQVTTRYHPALNIDVRRIYLEGCSMGGHGAFREGFRYPDTFAAVAPGAGWTTYKEFYNHWYDVAASPRMPEYVDPARLPALETASSVFQADNARWLWTFITFDRNDSVNPPQNHDPVIDKLRAAGSDRYATRIGQGGHCESFCTRCNFRFFLGKSVTERPADIVYTTNDLRYNKASWVAIDRLRYLNQWARIEVHAGESSIQVTTQNLLAFTLDLTQSPLHRVKSLAVKVDDSPPIKCLNVGRIHFESKVNSWYELVGWSLTPERRPSSRASKRPGLGGPLGDAFRSRFLVIYGTRGETLPANDSNPDWVAAQKFATEWNQWTSLHWNGEVPPRHRAADWWTPPYPFSPGAYIPQRQPLVMPLPDTTFGFDSLPRDANLILFGDVDSNWIVAQAAPRLPLELSSRQIRVRERIYRGDNVNYLFIAPSPFEADSREPSHYVVISRGYPSSDIDPQIYTAWNVGKDLEALPFYWPDYVVWDRNRPPSPTVQAPLKYLPEAFLDAGYFDENWQLDTAPPISHVQLTRQPPSHPHEPSVTKVAITAAARPGGFGVRAIEWRLGDGYWRQYTEPIDITIQGKVTLQVRAIDNCGQFVYDSTRSPNRGAPAMGNVETPQTFIIRLGDTIVRNDRVALSD